MKKTKKVLPAKKAAGKETRAKLSALASSLAPSDQVKQPARGVPGNAAVSPAPASAPAEKIPSWTYSLTDSRAQSLDERKRELMILAMEQGMAPSDITVSAVIRLGILRLGDTISAQIGSLAAWHSETLDTAKGSAKAAAFVLTDPVKAAMFEVEKAAVLRGLPLGPAGLSRARIIEYSLNKPFTKSDFARWKSDL